MKRPVWLIVSLAALFGLRAPVCVVACLESISPTSVAATQHGSETPPCHAAGDTPERPDPRGHECGCDDLQVVLTSADSPKSAGSHTLAALPVTWVSPSAARAAVAPHRLWTRPRKLPPPDLLLLKSTLLI